MKDIESLINVLSDESITFERNLDALLRKQTGSYYTGLKLAIGIVEELINSLDSKELFDKKFLEPCVGVGNFVYAYLICAFKLNYSKEEYEQILNNIYVCDINLDALKIYKKNLKYIAFELFGIELSDTYFNEHIGRSGLLYDLNKDNIQYIPISNVFSQEITSKGFDIVITNPPYKNLKAEKNQYDNENELLIDKKKYEMVGVSAGEHFKYSISGTLNIYKLFVEEILEKYLSITGICSLLIPSSILSDKTCSKLRKRIIESASVKSIRLIEENTPYLLSSQALCSMLFHKGLTTKEIKIDGSFNGDTQRGIIVPIEYILDKDTNDSILILSNNEYKIRKTMVSHPKIKELDFIINMRGELDISFNRCSITQKETEFQFYRGRNIGFYKLFETSPKEYVEPSFVQNSAKKDFVYNERLVCQQVVNIAKKKRVSFSLVPSNSVLGNSCNFIALRENKYSIDYLYLLGILNSSLIEWFFKLTSSNNHINNYEIDNFPIPVDYKYKSNLSSLVSEYLKSNDESLLDEIDALVFDAYGITKENKRKKKEDKDLTITIEEDKVVLDFYNDIVKMIPNVSLQECKDIINEKASITEICFQKYPNATRFEKTVLNYIEKKYLKINKGEILNHTTFKLSNLDLEMIENIPQGGNWKNIPKETVEKSKRLLRIAETGGRTTLYGRIDYSKPSYTITTYFNRPGNGTYVHPVHQRVISVREAARFQTFRDDYLFCGNKSDMLKQVGNAVPVLLAYNIGKSIKDKTGCCTSVDLFSGAGGMTYGFKLAGIKAVIANDITENACITLKTNSPEIEVCCGDITKTEIKDRIINMGRKHNADIICGGPPCQGFSMAGFRRTDDPRNELFKHFIDIVSQVNPKVIVFENVEGLLSYKNGETYNSIIELFSELGYKTEGRTVMANLYAVPQKRKRVIIICVRKDISLDPRDLYPEEITTNPEKQITAYETISDLETVECSEDAKYNNTISSDIIDYFKKIITAKEYINRIKKR